MWKHPGGLPESHLLLVPQKLSSKSENRNPPPETNSNFYLTADSNLDNRLALLKNVAPHPGQRKVLFGQAPRQ